MHILILTTAHPTDDVRVKSKFVDSFLAAGHRVSWVGPNYAFFAGDDLDERVEWHLTAFGAGRRRRLTSIPHVLRRCLSSDIRRSGVDWTYSPDPDAVLLALILRPILGSQAIFDIHEEFHKALLERWLGRGGQRLTARVIRGAISLLCSASDLVIGVNESVLRPYGGARRAVIVRNVAPAWFADGAPDGDVQRELTVVHGKALAENGTLVLLQALALVPADVPLRVLVLPGRGAADGQPYMPDFTALVETSGVAHRLRLCDAVTHEEMPALLDTCDVGMIAYPRGLGVGSLPNRLFEYMARGLPILAPSYSREIRAIVEAEGIGRTADFEDPAAVAAELAWFASHRDEVREMGRRARAAFRDRYSWEAAVAPVLVRISRRRGLPG